MKDARAILRQLYKGVDGFEIQKREAKRVRASRSSPTYGEVMPSATFQLLEALELRRTDVFYDLGCGVGKVVIAAAMSTPARRCVGIELAKDRVRRARRVLSTAVHDGLVAPRRVSIRHGDIARAKLSDATVVYTCSTAFPTRFTRALARRIAAMGRPITFVSTQVLDSHATLSLRRMVRLDMTWRRRTKVYIYDVSKA